MAFSEIKVTFFFWRGGEGGGGVGLYHKDYSILGVYPGVPLFTEITIHGIYKVREGL